MFSSSEDRIYQVLKMSLQLWDFVVFYVHLPILHHVDPNFAKIW